MRTISTAQEKIYQNDGKSIELRIQVRNYNGDLITLTELAANDWVIGFECGTDIDADSSDAIIRLKRNIFDDSLAYFNKKTRINKDPSGTWEPLLQLNREVIASVRYSADYSSSGLDWIEIFRGGIDDVDWADEVINVSCRDHWRQLADFWIEEETRYSDNTGNPVQDIMQEILDDNLAGDAPTIYVPVSPGWNVKKFKVTRQSLADQLLLLSDQIGWRLKYLWDDGTSQFRLTFKEPNRDDTTVLRTFNHDQYYSIKRMARSIAAVRNVISVTYGDSADLKTDGSPKTKTVTVSNATSIANYGRRWMGVTEDASSIIDTSTEATTMATAMLKDLQFPRVTQTVEMPLFVHVDLDDIYTFTANGIHSTVDLDLAVVSFRHYFTEGRAYTQIQCRDEGPIGKHGQWFHHGGGNGLARRQRLDSEINITGVAANSTNLGIQVSWATGETAGDANPSSRVRSDTYYEVYVTEPGGTPISTDLVGTTTGHTFLIHSEQTGLVPVGNLVDVHVRAISKGAESAFSTVTNKRALPVGTAGIDPAAGVFADGIGTSFNEQTRGTNHPPDFWEQDTGTWNTNAMLDDGTVYTSVTPRFGNKFLLLA